MRFDVPSLPRTAVWSKMVNYPFILNRESISTESCTKVRMHDNTFLRIVRYQEKEKTIEFGAAIHGFFDCHEECHAIVSSPSKVDANFPNQSHFYLVQTPRCPYLY